ncbi:hypothetical protein POTOM_013290 [Populus tomentosa]|uniref:DUF2062 domain-containing protein n=1 Tax=Populus tomentosa TaxID=118781 RepID=A0A8X8A5L5_POPTO|nr:hypothetical protein POTOM_013290 [Populus tomentosa]
MAMPEMGLLAWLDKKIVDPLYQIFRRGLEPKQLAFSTALGIALGIFPICGVTVLLCGLAIALLGSLCHAPTVLLANFIAPPIELSLVVPFLRFGEVMSGGPPFPLTSDALKKVLTGQASREVILSIAHAVSSHIAVGMASSSTLYFGRTQHNILAMFQGLGSQVQHRSIKPKETIKFTRRNQLKVRDV